MPFDAELQTLPPLPKPLPEYTYIDFAKVQVQPPPKPMSCDCPLCRPRFFYGGNTNPSNHEALTMLRRARARIEAGWTKNIMYDGNTNSVCAVGALICAVTGDTIPSQQGIPAVEAVASYLATLLPGIDSASALMSYNDLKFTSKEQVLALFDRGIAKLEATLGVPPMPARTNYMTFMAV